MFNDDIFDEEVNEELARERAEAQAELEAQRQASSVMDDDSVYMGKSQQSESPYINNSTSNNYGSTGGYTGPKYSGYTYTNPTGPTVGGPTGQPPTNKSNDGYAIASMVLGILSVVMFCSCLNLPFVVLSIIFAVVYLNSKGDQSKKGMALAGIITSIVSVVFVIISFIIILISGGLAEMTENEEFFEEYLDEYNYTLDDDTDYDYEYYDDYDDFFDEDSDDIL